MNAVSRLATRLLNLRVLTAALAAALLCAPAAAQEGQTAARPDRGVNPGGAYSVSDVENVSLQNGNVSLSIPLASLPPIAGGKLSLTLRAYYNSKLWNVTRSEQSGGFPSRSYVVDTPQLSDLGGWSVGAGYAVIIRDARDDFDYQYPAYADPNNGYDMAEFNRLSHNWYKVILRTPEGGEQELRPAFGYNYQTYGGWDHPRTYLWGYHTAVPSMTGAPVRYETTDGTYISAVVNPANHGSGVSWTLFMPDGTQAIRYADGVQRIRDTNGNSIKLYSDGAGAHYQDEQTGREIRAEYDPAGGNGFGRTRVWYQTVGGVWQHVDVIYGETVVRGKLYRVSDWNPNIYTETGQQGDVCRRDQQLPPQSVHVVREIVYPATEPNAAGRRFTFSYTSDTTETATTQNVFYWCGSWTTETYTRQASHGMGALSRMVTPSGAVADYTYTHTSQHDFRDLTTIDEMVAETLVSKNLTHDGVTDHWAYDIPNHGFASVTSVANPDGSTSTIKFFPTHPYFTRGYGSGQELAGRVHTTSDGRTVTQKRWLSRGTTWATGTDTYTAFNPYVEAEYTSLMEGGTPVKMTARKYQHDHNGNVTQVTEYDWFDPAAVQRDSYGVPTNVPAGAAVLRQTYTSYHNQAADVNSPGYYKVRGLTTGVPSHLGAVKETGTGASRTRVSYDGQAYGAAPTAGNPTQVSLLDDRGDADPNNDAWVTTSTAYGAYGNPSSSTDANGRVTQLFYDDATHALPTRVVVDPLNGTGAQTTTTAYDHWTGLVTSTTDANGQVSTVDYTNQLLGAVDPFGRPGMTRSPAGTAAGGATLYRKGYTFYEDGALRVRAESDLNTEGDRLLKGRSTHDQLGRVVLTEQSEDGSTYTISSRTVYAQAGRVTLQATPARNSSPESWTRITKDVYGRVVEVATFGGAAQPSATAAANTIANWTGSVTTSYAANETTVADQAGKARKSAVDALGRLVQVVEAPGVAGYGFVTDYAYDALGNLRRVDQGGQFRHFLYDSLSRLLRAKQPEQGNMAADADFPALADPAFGNSGGNWSVGYLYDGVGNLLKRKDARGVVTTFGYDGFNRNTSVSYAGESGAQTPPVTRSYDGAVRGKGQLHLVAQGGSTTSATYFDAYDAAGRPLAQRQKFETNGVWSADYASGYTYDIAGNVRTQTYPSGRSVAYAYDGAGRLGGFTGNLGDGAARTYADSFAYDAAGRMRQERYGTQTPVYNKHLFNSRGQLAEIRVSTHSLFAPGQETNWNRGAIINHFSDSGWGASGGGPDNNGNLRRQEVYIPNDDQISGYHNLVQQYGYDPLNRLASVEEKIHNSAPSFTQAYQYDRWGNRTIIQGGTSNAPAPQYAVSTATNRLSAPAGYAMNYDAAGNQTYDNYLGGQGGGGSRTYDAENRMTSAEFFAGQTQTASYAYDGDGRRVRRMAGSSAEVWQVYGAGGELLAEYAPHASPAQPQKEYGYRGGELLVTAAPGGGAAPAPRVNVAAASAGATATASTAYDAYGLTTAKAINGSRTYAGSYWNDQTAGALPDWLQIDFAGAKTINEVGLFFLQDNYGTAEPTESMTFTQFGITSFDVQYWTGSAWANVPGGGVTGNNKVWRKLSFAPLTTSKIRVVVNGTSDVWSRIVEVEAYQTSPNVAAAASGATVTASSAYDPYGLYAANAVNGSRTYAGSYWNDLTAGSFPDWLQVNFAGTKTVGEINVFFLQDNYATSEPTEATTFTQMGITSFEVQYWTGSAWATVPGGGVTNNNKVWRKFTFPAIITDRIRVVVNGATDVWSRVVEVEAYEGSSTPGGAEVRWLVADHLGTPRIVLDKTGSLSGLSRHDYLPFGEEVGAGVGGRMTSQGYSKFDGARQGFTGYEKDGESGLNYAQARYHSPTQGRFTGVDPQNAGAKPDDPQSWNAYAYARNSPLVYGDPDGRTYKLCTNGGQCTEYSDRDVNEWRKQDAVIFKKGRIYDKGGTQIGTYERTWFDDESLQFNRMVFGLQRMGPAMEKTILAVTAANLAPGVIGVGSGSLAGGGLTTLGNLNFVGVSAQEIIAINQAAGGVSALTGSPSTIIANMSYRVGFWEKAASVVRDIAGRHMFNDANKRTAQKVVELLMERNGVTGVSPAHIRSVIQKVAEGTLRDVDDIAKALAGK